MVSRTVAAVAAVILATVSYAPGSVKVLSGVPNYAAASPSTPAALARYPQGFSAALLPPEQRAAAYGFNPAEGVPEYTWWYGCSPTSGGMLIGYWDGRSGYGNLYDGDAGLWWGDGDAGTRSMVASTAHIVSGREKGYTYGYWGKSPSYPDHALHPDCIADFMLTVNGGSYSGNIAEGLQNYVAWDNPRTTINESYDAAASNQYALVRGGKFDYASFKAEINAGRPVLLDLRCAQSATKWVGHTVVAYGYQDDMFQVKAPMYDDKTLNLTVGGFAVRDTWANGVAQSEWVGWDDSIFSARIIDGVEWWPLLDCYGASWVYDDGTPGPYDWMLFDAITLDIAVPEPGALTWLALAGLPLLRRRNRALPIFD